MISINTQIENKDNKVHGWINPNPKIGLWMITPSNEFKTGGPVKQDLTSHTGSITLSVSIHDIHIFSLDFNMFGLVKSQYLILP